MENYFGRLGQLWAVCSAKFVWSERIYDTMFGLTVAFTNFHITLHSLRDEDKNWYCRYRNWLDSKGDDTKRKRAEIQARYKRKRSLRLSLGYRTNIFSDNDTQEEE